MHLFVHYFVRREAGLVFFERGGLVWWFLEGGERFWRIFGRGGLGFLGKDFWGLWGGLEFWKYMGRGEVWEFWRGEVFFGMNKYILLKLTIFF